MGSFVLYSWSARNQREGGTLMQYRTFGRTGWQVSEIGYGMWGMGGWTGSSDDEARASLQRSVELGCNFFDTAWAYGDGHSEKLIGQVLRERKGEFHLQRLGVEPLSPEAMSSRIPASDTARPAMPSSRQDSSL